MNTSASPAPSAAPVTHTALLRFVEDELLRAPMVMDMAMQEFGEGLRLGPGQASAGERQAAADLMMRLQSHRPRVIDRYVGSLREHTRSELAPSGAQARRDPAQKPRLALSLVDDDEVAIDVAISHAIEAIRSEAEAELRELLLFTSALAGDMEVRTDHNPLRPEAHARALWAAAQALPLSRGHQLNFVRQMALPMAAALRKSYAAACARLEAEGVEPAAYRTVIPPAGPRTPRSPAAAARIDHLSQLQQVVAQAAVGMAALVAERRGRRKSQTDDDVPAADRLDAAVDPDKPVSDLVQRLFEMLLADRRLPADVRPTLARLQPFVVRAALRDPTLIHEHDRGVWRFIDLLVHEATVYPGTDGAARESLLRFAHAVVDQLAQETDHTEQLYAWAIERIQRFAAKRLSDRCAMAEEQIATMQALEDRLSSADAAVSTMHGALGIAQLDTVPAALLDTPDHPPAGAAAQARWLSSLRAGQWLRLFHKGNWINAQLLWPGDRGEIWMFSDGRSEEPWAMRRSALLMLQGEGLAEEIEPRSVVHDAAERMMRRSAERQAAA